jgi:hypothetical protein
VVLESWLAAVALGLNAKLVANAASAAGAMAQPLLREARDHLWSDINARLTHESRQAAEDMDVAMREVAIAIVRAHLGAWNSPGFVDTP